jgi:two-component system cell cycle response regulator DivK
MSERAVMTTGKHILIVDDYPDALDIWVIFLQSVGYRVSTARDGAEALEQAARLHPDLIVLDLELPRVSGYEAAAQLRSNPDTRHIPLIAATGYSHERQLDRARDAGFDEIVVKPCDPDALVAVIERLLQDHEMVPVQLSHGEVASGHKNG